MGYRKASPADVESVVPPEVGGLWFLKDSLQTEHLGFTVREMVPGTDGKRHDHAKDGQEEIYYVFDGSLEITVGDATVRVEAGEALKVDPEETRQIHNRSDETAVIVIAGAPINQAR